jgi:hypothetical protein
MTTTVPLPPGAVFADDWEDDEPQPYRIIMGADRGPVVGNYGDQVRVWTGAAQLADGSVDDGSQIQQPCVHISNRNTDCIGGLTAAQARQLARALIAAADEIDRWAVT